ncbi:MAG: triose-phosphate isomerase [Moraxella sp.]|nr:triose-phosphate isomerase [Moraxella sp.]
MSQKYVIGNWKSNPATTDEAINLASKLVHSSTCLVGCAPSFVHLAAVGAVLADNIWLGAQDIHGRSADTGAFTGDICASQVANMGAKFVLVGHSERRQYHHETSELLTNKIRHAFDNGLSVIYCIGESKEQYQAEQTLAVLAKQLELLAPFSQEINFGKVGTLPKLIIAYEPVWAIGTGLTPTFEEVEAVHNFISETLSSLEVGAPILYGGSVNDKNATQFAQSPLTDGVLVGGASLKSDSFLAIVQAFSHKNSSS